MGERITVWAFRTSNATEYRRALSAVIEDAGGTLLWDTEPQSGQNDLRVLERPKVCMHWLPYLSGAEHLIAKLVGIRLDVHWLEARVQEGDHWDYSLFSAAQHVHSFSTRATYWGKQPYGPSPSRTAANTLASDWGLEVDAIERYHRAWDSPPWRRLHAFRRRGWAYEGDASEYGDIWQMFDFIRAVGGDDVTNTVDHATRHATTPVDTERLRFAVEAVAPPPRGE